jgi:hypothetical protein
MAPGMTHDHKASHRDGSPQEFRNCWKVVSARRVTAPDAPWARASLRRKRAAAAVTDSCHTRPVGAHPLWRLRGWPSPAAPARPSTPPPQRPPECLPTCAFPPPKASTTPQRGGQAGADRRCRRCVCQLCPQHRPLRRRRRCLDCPRLPLRRHRGSAHLAWQCPRLLTMSLPQPLPQPLPLRCLPA